MIERPRTVRPLAMDLHGTMNDRPIGDGRPDLPAARGGGSPGCPADAHPGAAHIHRAPSLGNAGAVRDAAEHTLDACGSLRQALARYDRRP